MKKMLVIKRYVHKLFMVCALAILASSCQNNDDENAGVSTIQLNILSNVQVVTRSSSNEQTLYNGYVFIFDKNGESQKGVYKLTPSDIININTYDKKILVPMNIDTDAKIAVVLNSTLSPDVTDISSVTFANMDSSFPLTKGGFESTDKDGLPMYGVLTWGKKPNIVNIKRSVAKLQVMIDKTVGGSHGNTFIAGRVKYQIYNHATNGKITYNATPTELNDSETNTTPTTSIDDAEIKRGVAKSDDNSTGAIYIYEYKYSTKIINQTASTTISNRICSKDRLAIIIKNSSNNRYYRLDLCNLGPRYIDIVRNHHYKIVIKEVNSDGYATANEALSAEATNIVRNNRRYRKHNNKQRRLCNKHWRRAFRGHDSRE